MCYSYESSIYAWAISAIIAIYIWIRNNKYDRWNSAFILTFSIVQLFEAILWKNRASRATSNATRDAANTYEIDNTTAKLISVAIFAQPLVQTLGAYLSMEQSSPVRPYLLCAIFIFAAMVVWAIHRATTEDFLVTVGPNGHLIWKPQHGTLIGNELFFKLYLFGMFFGLAATFPSSQLLLLVVGGATFVWARLQYNNTEEFGSFWCHVAVMYSMAALVV